MHRLLFRMVRATVMQKRDVQRLAGITYVMREDAASADELGNFSLPDKLHHVLIDLPDAERKCAAFVKVKAVIVAIPDIDTQIIGVLDQIQQRFPTELSLAWLIHIGEMVRFILWTYSAPDQISYICQGDELVRIDRMNLPCFNVVVVKSNRIKIVK